MVFDFSYSTSNNLVVQIGKVSHFILNLGFHLTNSILLFYHTNKTTLMFVIQLHYQAFKNRSSSSTNYQSCNTLLK